MPRTVILFDKTYVIKNREEGPRNEARTYNGLPYSPSLSKPDSRRTTMMQPSPNHSA